MDKIEIKEGDWFRITYQRHFAHGQAFRCKQVTAPKLKGNPDSKPLDLGRMICFFVEFAAPGRPGMHAVPEEWCARLDGPPRIAVGRIIKSMKTNRFTRG